MAMPATDLAAVPAMVPVARRRRRSAFLSNGKAVSGLAVLIVLLVVAVVGPWLEPYDPGARSDDLLVGPGAAHWFGTTNLGQDILSQILDGTRSVMLVGLGAVFGGLARLGARRLLV